MLQKNTKNSSIPVASMPSQATINKDTRRVLLRKRVTETHAVVICRKLTTIRHQSQTRSQKRLNRIQKQQQRNNDDATPASGESPMKNSISASRRRRLHALGSSQICLFPFPTMLETDFDDVYDALKDRSKPIQFDEFGGPLDITDRQIV
jgi:hypothetical protein